jgi:hypothetical protein
VLSGLVRLGCGLLAAVNLWWGAWALVAPRNFYENFPGFGHRWVAAYPPYNAHLVTDLGATFLTLGFLLAAAAVIADRRLRWVVLGGVLIFNGLHLAFHAANHGTMAAFDYGASVASLVAGVVAPLVLIALDVVAGRFGRTAGNASA